jgi:hypothetical protein
MTSWRLPSNGSTNHSESSAICLKVDEKQACSIKYQLAIANPRWRHAQY